MLLRPLIAVCALGWATTTNYTNHAPLIPVLTEALGFGPAQAGLLSTGLFATIAVIGVPAGSLTDRLGPKTVAALGLLLALLGTAGLGFAQSFTALLLLKIVSGVGAGASFVAGVRYGNMAFPPDQRHRAQGWYGGAVALGAGSALYILPLLEHLMDWRGAFLAAAGLMAGPLLAWLVLAPDARVAAPSASPLRVLADWRSWMIGLMHTSTFGVSVIVGSWIAVFLVHDFKLALVDAGAIGSLVLVAGVVSRPIGGSLLDGGHLSAAAAILLSLLVAALAIAALAWPGRPLILAIAAIVVFGFATNLPYAAMMSTTMQALPAAPGAAIGAMTAVTLLLMAVGTAAVGASFEATGSFTTGFAAVAICCAVVFAASGPALARMRR